MVNALNYQQQATDQASQLYRDMYGQSKDLLSPYMQAGAQALPGLSNLASQSGVGHQYIDNLNAGFDPSTMGGDLYNYQRQQTEEMARRMNQGQGVTGSAAMDRLLDADMRFRSGWDDKIYNRWYGKNVDLFNMANQGLNQDYQRQMGIAGLGQNAAVNMANAGSNFANAQSGLLTNMANAQASNLLSQNALSAQQSQDTANMWAGLAGTVAPTVIQKYGDDIWRGISGLWS